MVGNGLNAKHRSKPKDLPWEDKLINLAILLIKPFEQIAKGIWHGYLPYGIIFLSNICLYSLFLSDLDLYLINQVPGLNWALGSVRSKWPFAYLAFLSLMPLAVWAAIMAAYWDKMQRDLKSALFESKIKTPSGKLPFLISDEYIDENARELILNKNGTGIELFKENQKLLAENLEIFIDQISENRETSEIEIVYSRERLEKLVEYNHPMVKKPNTICIGSSRGKVRYFDFTKDPHLLVAGQSGNGKSTFLRQAIVSLYMANKDMKFTLIDLKEGLEFQTFEHLPRIKVIENHEDAVSKLKNLCEIEMKYRKELLRKNKATDIEAFNKISKKVDADGSPYNGAKLCRKMVIIDEAAQLFYKRGGSAQGEKNAKLFTTEIASTSRAIGIHLVICTQRPDRNTVDPLTKANLTAKLCFRLPNLASSRTVLDTGRAAKLPEIKGRAIFEYGNGNSEVQVPFLSAEKAKSLLSQYKKKKKPGAKSSEPETTTNKFSPPTT